MSTSTQPDFSPTITFTIALPSLLNIQTLTMNSSSDTARDDLEEVPENTGFLSGEISNATNSRWAYWPFWTSQSGLLSISLLLLLISFLHQPTDTQCARQLSPYYIAPIIDSGIIKYESAVISNPFPADSKWSGPPTPETEAAWKDIWDNPSIAIPRNKLDLLNKSREGDWREAPTESRPDSVAGLTEMFHQLHCLASFMSFLGPI
ncbi:hypothetical protein NA57DRAFT_50552 [Rhizodiscina lignyota]|uniref:Uncharacterized protein n=1 Tax=Rhizodiscina lignyota TaxID=1504668 RepID=A0A9P4IQU6_9PEZI|nr:hypothetical protein NA57DRAFT_50552 [Rhizodiscina lignyota]